MLYVSHGVSLHMLCLSKTYGVTNLFLLAAFAPFALGSVSRAGWASARSAADRTDGHCADTRSISTSTAAGSRNCESAAIASSWRF